MRILFTGVGRRIELLQAFRNAALSLGKEIKIYGADMNGTAPALAYCDHTRRVVSMKDPRYIDELLRICNSDKIDLLIPTIDTDLLLLSENKDKFEANGTKVLISRSEQIKICRDKNLTSKFFIECGVKAPMPVNDWREYKGGFPAFIKPKDGSSSINAHKVENIEELEQYSKVVPDYIVQPFVSGREYTIDIFCDRDGEPMSIVPRERLQVRAGEVLKTRIELDQTMIMESRKICEAFKPFGPLTVQLIRDEAGIDWFIEINPRYGGGAPLSMKAGARSAETVLRMIVGENVVREQVIADGAVYSRFDQSVCIKEGKSEIKGVIFDLDDTLYSEKSYVRSGFHAVSEFLGADTYAEKLWEFFEAGVPAIDELLKELGREDDKEAVLGIYRCHKPDIRLYPGVREMLDELKEKGIKVGIITDGRPEGQRNKLEALGLGDIETIITDELGGTQFRKPCDIAFRIMLTRWKTDPDKVVYVGDNASKDFQAPRQLGMRSMWFMNDDGLYSEHTYSYESGIVTNNIADMKKFLLAGSL